LASSRSKPLLSFSPKELDRARATVSAPIAEKTLDDECPSGILMAGNERPQTLPRVCGRFLFVTDHATFGCPPIRSHPRHFLSGREWQFPFAVWHFHATASSLSGTSQDRWCRQWPRVELPNHPRSGRRAASQRKHDPQRGRFRPAAGLPVR
jgi:hypothetical protein